jgi:hypothetical protein
MGASQLLQLAFLALSSASSNGADAIHPKRDYLTIEEKENGYQLGPDMWVRPPKSQWAVANKRLADKRSIHCPVCISLAKRLYETVSGIADSTGGAKIATSWRMKNSQREFKMTDAMKSDTVIGEAMEELCDSREVPSALPGVAKTKQAATTDADGKGHLAMGIKLSTAKETFSWREGGRDGVEFTKTGYVDICEDLVQDDEDGLIDAVSSRNSSPNSRYPPPPPALVSPHCTYTPPPNRFPEVNPLQVKKSDSLDDMLKIMCETKLGACDAFEMEAALKEPEPVEGDTPVEETAAAEEKPKKKKRKRKKKKKKASIENVS